PIRAPLGVNVPGLTMAGFQLTLHGRIWVIPEDRIVALHLPKMHSRAPPNRYCRGITFSYYVEA
ncbi:MAG: hypothetical protein WB543_07735, partial [Candidatus Acidiferrum sp.]